MKKLTLLLAPALLLAGNIAQAHSPGEHARVYFKNLQDGQTVTAPSAPLPWSSLRVLRDLRARLSSTARPGEFLAENAEDAGEEVSASQRPCSSLSSPQRSHEREEVERGGARAQRRREELQGRWRRFPHRLRTEPASFLSPPRIWCARRSLVRLAG